MEAQMQITWESSEHGLEAREASHRMMNLLATMLAMFRRDFSRFDDPRVRGSVAQLEGQVLAASALLRTISSAPAGEDAEVNVYIESLGHVLSRAILGPANIGCEIFSDGGRLPVEVCERLGYIIFELVFNANKYAFAGRNDGVVRVEMLRSGGEWRCTVCDNGIGVTAAGCGTGLNILDTLARSLRGRLIIRSDASGTSICIVLPEQPIGVLPTLPAAVNAAMRLNPESLCQ
jgi:two-component sensor histidine kinase